MEVIWIFVGGALWPVGGNVIIALSCRRRGLPWWSGFRPFFYRYLSRMNWLEWLAILSLGVLSMAIMAIGASSRQ